MTEEQLTNSDLASMSPEAISTARKAGKLHRLLNGNTPANLTPVTSEEGAAHLAAGHTHESLGSLITERNQRITNTGA